MNDHKATGAPPMTASDGVWDPDMSYVRLGSGAPLVLLPGLTANHLPPRGNERKGLIGTMAHFAADHEVWSVTRPRGLASGTTIADLARTYADAMRTHFDGPVDVVGTSTGGSIALQLAADHPDVVRRVVVIAAAHRLGAGRRVQRRVAETIRAGRPRRGFAELAATSAARGWSRRLMWVGGWLLEPAVGRHGYDDMLTVIDAEDRFDLSDRLTDITCPVLVVGGDRDAFYSADLFRETAQNVPDGRLVLYPGTGHMGVIRSDRLAGDVLGFLDH